MSDQGRALVEAYFREALRNAPPLPPPRQEPPTIHWTELPPSRPGEPLAEEWDFYRQNVGRWLAEGRAGRFVIIKKQEAAGFFDTWAAAREEGLKRYLLEPFLVQPILEREPLVFIRGLSVPCPD